MNKENVKINNEYQLKADQIKRFVEKDSEEVLSPLNPPDAYAPPFLEQIAYKEYHLFIQKFIDEHTVCLKKLMSFEEVLSSFQTQGLYGKTSINEGLKQFFTFLDNNIAIHNIKEEKILFPLLHERLIINGEHSIVSGTESPKTVVDMLEDDHIKIMQSASVTFNLFGLASRLPDAKSRAITLDTAIEQGKSLIELIRLHIFREDNVVFPLAHKFISHEEFDLLETQISRYNNY